MEKILAVLSLVIMFNCNSLVKTNSKTITITGNNLKNIVSYLASDKLQGRATGSEGIDKAADYIEKKFKSYGIKPYFETYRDNSTVGEKTAFNVIGFIEGSDPSLKDEVIILGAHYDHIGFGKKVGNDSIANGANDDASGTSAVLSMAKYFAAKNNNKRSMMFALFSGEEMGLLGSKHLAEKLKSNDLDLYAMIEFEMIGVPFKDRDYETFITGYDMSNMAQVMNTYIGSNYIGKSDIAVKYHLFKQSDNYAFYKVFDVPCQTISSCDLSNYDYYHHVDDEADKLDYEFMASVINKVIPAIEKISNMPTKEIKMKNG